MADYQGPLVFDLTPLMVVARQQRAPIHLKSVPIQPKPILAGLLGGVAGALPMFLFIWWAPWWLTLMILLGGVAGGLWFVLWRRGSGLRQHMWRTVYDQARAGENRIWYCGRDVTREPDQGLVTLISLPQTGDPR